MWRMLTGVMDASPTVKLLAVHSVNRCTAGQGDSTTDPQPGPAHYDSLVSQLSSRGQHRHKVTVSNNTITEQVDGTERLKLQDSCLSMRHRFCLRDSINEVGGGEKALLQYERARKGGLGSGGCGFVAAMLACWTLRVGPVSTSRR